MADVEIFEVGPRDGLQNEARTIPTAEKVALVDALSQCGFRRIEAASFVSPKWVPQMADAAEVMARIERAPDVRYSALTPNMRGYERARDAGADEVAVFAAASEGFSKANLNASVDEALGRFAPVAEAAKADGRRLRGYVSVVVECPYDGPVPPTHVARVVAALRVMGCQEVSLGDTIGRGRPEAVDAMLAAVLEEMPTESLAGHFHDTSGRALDNVDVALERGLRVFDGAVGGLGGCPYAPGAAGNVATEALLDHLEGCDFSTGLDRDCVEKAGRMAQALRSRTAA